MTEQLYLDDTLTDLKNKICACLTRSLDLKITAGQYLTRGAPRTLQTLGAPELFHPDSERSTSTCPPHIIPTTAKVKQIAR